MFEYEVLARIDAEYEERKAKEELESLDEAVSIRIGKYGLEVDGDGRAYRGFDKDPYFKFFKGKNVRTSEKYIRISMLEPRVVEHKGGHWGKFTQEDKDMLIQLLNSPSDKILSNGYHCKNGWEAVIADATDQINKYPQGSTIDYNFNWPCPDYNQLPLKRYD